MISTFLAVTLLFMLSMFMESPSGNVVASVDKLELINCVEKDNFGVCDVQFPNSEISEEGYAKRLEG